MTTQILLQRSSTLVLIDSEQETEVFLRTIVHKEDTQFIINTHSLHNATLLRKFLPRYLTVPRPLYADRKKRHTELGKELAAAEASRRAETARKTAETKKKNQAAKGKDLATPASAGIGSIPPLHAVAVAQAHRVPPSTPVSGLPSHAPVATNSNLDVEMHWVQETGR